jgi:gluconate kinase
MKTVLILYGEMGCGKTYRGKMRARDWGATFFDGDDVIPPAMLERVKQFKPLSKEMLDDYIHNHLAPAIIQQGDDVIVAQALYMQEHRGFLESYLEQRGYRVQFEHVGCSFKRNVKQLWSRPNGFRWVLYWLMNKPFFQD